MEEERRTRKRRYSFTAVSTLALGQSVCVAAKVACWADRSMDFTERCTRFCLVDIIVKGRRRNGEEMEKRCAHAEEGFASMQRKIEI